MPDYEKMYYVLFNEITKVIEQLQEVQQKTEEMYIDAYEKSAIKVNNDN